MTDKATSTIPELPDGPYDLEFFFDPLCPFAWQTSVWIRRVAELRDLKIGWRFVSLKFINESDENLSPQMLAMHDVGLRYHRICAAARESMGNETVGLLYRRWGESYWYTRVDGDVVDRFAKALAQTSPEEVAGTLNLTEDLLAAADDGSWDATIRAETDEAFRRTGDDVGTPIITYDPPTGNSLFGPVISEIPDDETAVRFYDALRTFVDFPAFSELKRTDRAPLDLPLLAD